MAKYVVKNERGEWLSFAEGVAYWSNTRAERVTFGEKVDARGYAGYWRGKVYRVRKLTARREREAILALMRRVCDDPAHEDRRALWEAIEKVEALEHRRKHAER